jgi:hypothetical protein
MGIDLVGGSKVAPLNSQRWCLFRMGVKEMGEVVLFEHDFFVDCSAFSSFSFYQRISLFLLQRIESDSEAIDIYFLHR